MSLHLSSGDSSATWIPWFPIAATIGLATFICLLILFVEVEGPLVASILIGFLFAQILFAAVWTTLAPWRFSVRFSSGVVFVLMLCLCMFRCAYRDGGGTGVALPITGAMLIQWLIFQIPLWYLRRSGWQLARAGDPIDFPRKEFQFGIRHLLVWTTLVAIFMGIVRIVLPSLQVANADISGSLNIGLHLTLGNSLIALPIVWGCLSRHYFWLWMLVAFLACCLVSIGQWLIIQSFSMQFDFLLSINISQTIASILVMLAVRLTGYRLHQSAAGARAN